MIFVSLWVVCAIVAAVIGSKKDEAGLGFIFGALLGPIGVLIVLASSGNRKQCPTCKESIHKEAQVCPHCGRDVPRFA